MSSDVTSSEIPGTRWRRRKEARPGEILEAALSCFAERGFAATKLDDVANRAGVTKGTVYLYFPNKEELFKAVVRTEIVPNLERIESTVARENLSATEALASVIRFFGERFHKSRFAPLPKLVISESGNFPELARFYVDEVVGRGFSLIGGIVRRGIASGEFRVADVESVVYCVIAPVIFATLYRHSIEPHAPGRPIPEDLIETHISLILGGIRRVSVTEGTEDEQ